MTTMRTTKTVALPQRFRRQSDGTECDIQTQLLFALLSFQTCIGSSAFPRMGWSGLSGVNTEFAVWNRVGKVRARSGVIRFSGKSRFGVAQKR